MGFLLRQLITIALASLVTISPSKAAENLADRSNPVEVFEAQALRIEDGDTLDVVRLDGTPERLILAAIGSPEKGQPFWRESKVNLARLVLDKPITVEVVSRFTSAGRKQARLFGAEGDVAVEQVRAGYAMLYRDPERGVDMTAHMSPSEAAEYESAQMFAERDKRGIWSDANVLPPWQWARSQN